MLIAAVLIAAFFSAWAGFAMSAIRHGLSKTISIGGGFVVGAIAMAIAMQFIVPGQSPILLPKNINDTQSAGRFLVGTWVYAKPITSTSYPDWLRWEIKADGTLTQQSARPSDSSWGAPQRFTYDVITEKYADTGERYYALKIKEDGVKAIITDDGRLFMTIGMGKYPAFFSRGDKSLGN